ncbi:hypothetical protein FUAX_04670 [Fulvitalea axinellae]|uniref:AraC effector-binding domain-containing protein n=1 Tax=Fulvitalea axinellae TaxID=1182444 RepID=A0AAU9DB40_9BACT|nr:hypothetical protein FUAX_04670 [Fulvitalea axinellae]
METIVKNIEVKTLPRTTLAFHGGAGAYQKDRSLYQRHRQELFAWADSKGLLAGGDFQYLILYRDSPEVARYGASEMSLCLTVPAETQTEEPIGKTTLDLGEYAVCECELSPRDFPKVWEWIFGEWLSEHGFRPIAGAPYFERYPEAPAGELFRVDFCVPVEGD